MVHFCVKVTDAAAYIVIGVLGGELQWKDWLKTDQFLGHNFGEGKGVESVKSPLTTTLSLTITTRHSALFGISANPGPWNFQWLFFFSPKKTNFRKIDHRCTSVRRSSRFYRHPSTAAAPAFQLPATIEDIILDGVRRPLAGIVHRLTRADLGVMVAPPNQSCDHACAETMGNNQQLLRS